MHRPFRAALAATTALAVSALSLVGVAPPASATPSVGFHTMTPVLLFDTRIGGTPLESGVEQAITVAGAGGVPGNATRAAVRLTTLDTVGLGELYVHDCGAFDPTDPVISELTAHPEAALALPTLVAGGFCVTSTASTDLTVVVEGYENGDVGGANYVEITDAPLASNRTVAAGSVTPLGVFGVGGTPLTATAVSVSLTARSTSSLFVTLFSCDDPRPLASTLPHDGRASGSATSAVVDLAVDGTLCLYSSADATVGVRLFGYYDPAAQATAAGPVLFTSTPHAPPGFVAVPPRRLFDTRDAGSPVAGGTSYVLDLTTVVPAAATDVVMNVTVTDTVGPGFVTVYPCSDTQPTASNLNYVARQTVPNLVTVALGDGRVCLFTSATTHMLADLAGWYELDGGDGLVSVTPSRLFDTRDRGARLPAGSVYELDLSGTIGTDASAVIMNVTVDDPLGAGFVTVYPCSAAQPTASNVNYVARQTVPNLVTVAVGADRHVCFYTSNATNLLADIGGWYARSSSVGFIGRSPTRLFDTRDTAGPLDDGEIFGYTFGPGDAPGAADAVVALVMNVTVADPSGAGYVTAFPCAADQPTASNVNYVAGQVVPNLAIVPVDIDDDVCFYVKRQTHLLADLAGYFTALPVLDFTLTT